MITKAKFGHLFAQKKFSLIIEIVFKELANVVEALAHPLWFQAMHVEFKALVKKNTWELVPPRRD